MALIKKKETNGTVDIGAALGNLSSDVSKKVNTAKSNIRTGIQTGIQNATTDFENFSDKYADDIPGFTLLGSAIKSNHNTRMYRADQNKADAKLDELEGTRPEYADSDELTKAKGDLAEIESHQNDAKDKYDDRIQQALDNIEKYSEFKYDVESDPLWNSVRSQYQRNAMLGMKDTLGAAANLTGGYASSYAQAAAQQAYQNNIAQMTDIIPELQDKALDRFNANHNMALDNFSALESAYQNELAEWQNNRNYYYNKVAEMSDDEWAHYMDNLSAWMADRSYWTDWRNQAIQNQQWQMQLDEEKSQFRQQMLFNYVNMGVSAGTSIATSAIPAAASLAGTGINAGVDLVGMGLDYKMANKQLDEEKRQFDATHGLGDYATTPTSTGYSSGGSSGYSGGSSGSSGKKSSGSGSGKKSSGSGSGKKSGNSSSGSKSGSGSSGTSSKGVTLYDQPIGPLTPGSSASEIQAAYDSGVFNNTNYTDPDEEYKRLMRAANR